MKQNIKLVELSQMKAKKNNQFIDPAMFPSIAGLLGAKNHAKAWLDRETAIKFSKLYFYEISKRKNTFPFKIKFTFGNRKIDGIPSFAFNPFLTCVNRPCLVACYAAKGNYICLQKLKTETENTAYYYFKRKQFLKEFDAFLTQNERFYPYFRYFESGDFLNSQNVKDFLEVSKKHPKIKFLIRTKKSYFVKSIVKNKSELPANVVLRLSNFSFSNFSNFENQNDFLKTDCQKDPGKGINICPGARVGCKNCLKCWKKTFKEIIFKKH